MKVVIPAVHIRVKSSLIVIETLKQLTFKGIIPFSMLKMARLWLRFSESLYNQPYKIMSKSIQVQRVQAASQAQLVNHLEAAEIITLQKENNFLKLLKPHQQRRGF
jgi:hypothetical protein